MDDFRPSRTTAKLPPAIASFMSRVRQSSTEPDNSSQSERPSKFALTPEELKTTKTPKTSDVKGHSKDFSVSPLVSIQSSHHDSPGMVQVEMSPTSKVSPHSFGDQKPSQGSALKSNDILRRGWIDDDNQTDKKVSEALMTPTPSFVSSSNPQVSTTDIVSSSYFSSDASITVTTSSSAVNTYDTPRAVKKQLKSNIVYPEDTNREQSSYTVNQRSKGPLEYSQRNEEPSKQKFTQMWNAGHFDEPEIKQIDFPGVHQRRSTESTVTTGHTRASNRPPPSPNTPITPMSQHTHSDLAPHKFTYPTSHMASNGPPTHNSHWSQQPSVSTSVAVTQGYNTRPDTGQSISYNLANPRSRNYRPPSSQGGFAGGEIRRAQTFSSGHESGRSNGYSREERVVISPISDDSLPNSPTYFITNNPNDNRDTPSPATQVSILKALSDRKSLNLAQQYKEKPQEFGAQNT